MNTKFKNYKILQVYNLVHYDSDFSVLYQKLKSAKKQTYSHNEKIIILHNDTEYFYYDQKIGFTIHNLLTCWQELDIPWHVLTIITNHYGYQNTITNYKKFHPGDSPEIIFSLVNNNSYADCLATLLNTTLTYKKIQYFALGLYGRTNRAHRNAFVKWLQYNKLTQNFLLSYNCLQCIRPSIEDNKNLNNNKMDTTLNFVSAKSSRINESFLSVNSESFLPWINEPELSYKNKLLDSDPEQFYNCCFLDVVSETTFAYPYPFISEKTLRPILLETPFVLFSGPGTLQCLKDHGFLTFGDFWDENYDTETNHVLRFYQICSIIDKLARLSLDEYKKMYEDMMPILVHNKKTLYNYIENIYTPFYKRLGIT